MELHGLFKGNLRYLQYHIITNSLLSRHIRPIPGANLHWHFAITPTKFSQNYTYVVQQLNDVIFKTINILIDSVINTLTFTYYY